MGHYSGDPKLGDSFFRPSLKLDCLCLFPCPEVGKLGLGIQPAVYILAGKRNGTLYVGVTSDLVKRVWQHKGNLVQGYTKRYAVHLLVWYELHTTMESAITREKLLKKWKRRWKLELIESLNPDWHDLYDSIV